MSAVALALALALTAAPAEAELAPERGEQQEEPGLPSGPVLTVELHGSLLTDSMNEPLVNATFGLGVTGGYRFGMFGVFLMVEHNAWVALELDAGVEAGAFNIGLGGEIIWGGGLLRSAMAIGTSTLLHRTLFDGPGTTGFFIDFRPIGARWCLTEGMHIGLDPITFAIVAPVLSGIPLMRVLYRTQVNVTWSF